MLGVFTKAAALAIVVQMLVAIYKAHWKVGFFMNWGSAPNRGEGYEYSLTLLVVALVLFLLGGGAYGIDALLG